VEGGNGDDGGRKCVETAATQSAAWTRSGKRKGACDARVAVVEESEGEKKRGERDGVERLSFERRRGEAGEGGGRLGATCGQEKEWRGGLGCGATWAGTTWARRLQAAQTRTNRTSNTRCRGGARRDGITCSVVQATRQEQIGPAKGG
jgi:hypothetical protein